MCGRGYPLAKGLSNNYWFIGTRVNGFTLLELMVAIALFSLISAAAYKLFTAVAQAREVTQSVLADLDKLQRAEMVLEKDLFQMARRPVRDEQGRQQPALKVPGNGGLLMEFTRSGWQNPLQVTRSTLQRVAYALEEDQLIRYYWPMLDRAPDTRPIRQSVMSGVNRINIRLLDGHKLWVNSWPPRHKFQQRASGEGLAQLPVAVELTIVHEKMGSMVTIVPLVSYQPRQADQGNGMAPGNRSHQPGDFRPPIREGIDGN